MNRINRILLILSGLIVLFSIVIISVFAIRTNQGKYPEPSSRPEIEEAAVWDSDLGMYINSEFTKDEYGNYVLKEEYDSGKSSDDSPEAIWLKEHEGSDNAIDQAIIQSTNLSIPPELGLLSSIQPKDIPGMAEAMRTIPVSNLPELWERLLNEPAFRAQKIFVMELMTGVIIDQGQFDSNSQIRWIEEFTKRKNSLPTEFHYSDKEKYGTLMLPSLVERLEKNGLNEEETRLFLDLADIPSGQKGITPLDSSKDEEKRIVTWIDNNAEYLKGLREIIQE